jgi:hypothetical protein
LRHTNYVRQKSERTQRFCHGSQPNIKAGKMEKRLFIFIVLLTGLASCKKENVDSDAAMRKEVMAYVDSFFFDLNSRNIKTIWSKELLEIDFFPDSKDGNGGVANGKYISFNRDLWSYLPHDRKKFFVYHELAHSVLSRPHTNTLLPNGEYKSLMRGGQILSNKSEGIRFKGFREQYYIDELFDTTTVIPSWAKNTFDLAQIQDTLSVKLFKNNAIINHEINTNNNFRIESYVFHDSLNQKQVGVVWNKKGTAFESFLIKRGIPTVHSLDILNYQYDDFGFIANPLASKYYSLIIEKRDNYLYYFVDGIFHFYKEFQANDINTIEFYSNDNIGDYLKIIEF